MTGVRPRVLIVDDEPKLVRLAREVLQATGFDVLTAATGQEAIEAVALEQPDLVLLDIMLPAGMDGYDVAERIRQFSGVPIIMLTAKDRQVDLLRGFDVGADDYITKPFEARELLARIRAVLRRAQQSPATPSEAEIICGELHIDLARYHVRIGDRTVLLTKTEFNLLRELATHKNQVMEHSRLLAAVWGPAYRDDVDYLRAYIRYLRRKLEPEPSRPRYIITHTGVGYMLACPDPPDAG
ncbi:MAG: response regulator transcription factor [Chloroflexi bacterium]|nr:response regulator transcription factor [Chloroflexota bacterium]